jgi:alpha-galactosidase
MSGVTVAVIGGGSSMFVPGLVRRMLEIDAFEPAELRLMDIDARRLAVMEQLASQLARAERRSLSVTATTSQREALEGVTFAIVAISVGGMAAWESDIELPAKHGVFMHIADSIGPGGIFRALRNAPVVASVARDLAEVAPQAILFNYTNPASANAMVMAEASPVRSVSLCSCSPRPFQREWLAELVGVEAPDIVVPMRVGGINHCTGILSLRLRDGRDAVPLARDRDDTGVVAWAIDTFGVIPYCWNHWVEFFPQLQRLEADYEGRAQGLSMRYGRYVYDMEQQRSRMRGWEEVAARWSAEGGEHRLADLPHGPEDEGIVVAEVMQAVLEDRGGQFVVNVPNTSLIPNLPAEAVVEVPAVVNGEGIHPVGIGPLPTGLAAVLGRHALVQRLTAEAALRGDIGLLRQAMTADPLLDASLEPAGIEALMREMLAANAPYLPMFERFGAM